MRNSAFWLIQMTCSECFLIQLGTTCPRMVVPPCTEGALLHQLPTKKMSTGLPTEQADGIVFSTEGPSSQLTLAIKLTKLTNICAGRSHQQCLECLLLAVIGRASCFLLSSALDSVYPYWLRLLGVRVYFQKHQKENGEFLCSVRLKSHLIHTYRAHFSK